MPNRFLTSKEASQLLLDELNRLNKQEREALVCYLQVKLGGFPPTLDKQQAIGYKRK